MADSRPVTGLREILPRLAPGTELRDGLERILRGRTGALIVLGYDPEVETISDGGFQLDVAFAPTRLRELAKMDGAVILSSDGCRIQRANVQLVPDPSIPTDESGTRHRAAERTAIHTGYPVISVSQSMSIISVYVEGQRYVLEDSATILSHANQAIATMERYKSRLDTDSAALTSAEIEDFVSLRDALTVVQRLEMVRRVSSEIDRRVMELGADGRQLSLQQAELLGKNDINRSLIIRDYLASVERPTSEELARGLDLLEALTDAELLDLTAVARVLDYPSSIEVLDQPVSPRGYRLLNRIPRLQYAQIDRLVGTFGTLQNLLGASAEDLREVDGIGPVWARHIREGLSRLAEASLADKLHG